MTVVGEHPPILGIDTNSFGFHVVSSAPIFMPGAGDADDSDDRRCQGWTLASSKDWYDRLRITHSVAIEFFRHLPKATSLWVEEPLVLSKNPATTKKLVMMAGVLYAAFLEAKPDATWWWVDVAAWRKQVLGKGSGKTEELKGLARSVVQAGWPQYPDPEFDRLATLYDSQADLYDAHCLMLYGTQILASGLVRIK